MGRTYDRTSRQVKLGPSLRSCPSYYRHVGFAFALSPSGAMFHSLGRFILGHVAATHTDSTSPNKRSLWGRGGVDKRLKNVNARFLAPRALPPVAPGFRPWPFVPRLRSGKRSILYPRSVAPRGPWLLPLAFCPQALVGYTLDLVPPERCPLWALAFAQAPHMFQLFWNWPSTTT